MEISRQALAKTSAKLQASIEQGEMNPQLPLHQARDLILALMHGMASQHMANEPHLPIGEGRYGSLIPAAAELFRKAWSKA
jgi:hypothetical protein